MLDKIRNCDITDDLFDSMIFCVTGFNKRQREQLCKIIKDRGGMIFDKVSSSVTHVLSARTDIHSNQEVTLVKEWAYFEMCSSHMTCAQCTTVQIEKSRYRRSEWFKSKSEKSCGRDSVRWKLLESSIKNFIVKF